MKRKLAIFGLLFCLLIGIAVPAIPVSSAAAYDGQVDLETLIDGTKRLFIAFEGENDYGSVFCNDSGAVSIGILSWHAQRALLLLQRICKMDPSLSRQLLGDTLYNEVVNSAASAWKNRRLNSDEKARVSSLLRTDVGIQAQEAQAREDILGYINDAWKAGIRTEAAILYYCSIENQYGSGGVVTFMKYLRQSMGITANDTINSLEEFHDAVKKAAQSYSYIGSHLAYRNKVYEFVVNVLHWSTTGSLTPVTPPPAPEPPPVCENCPSAGYTDVPAPGNWAHEGIDYAISNGLFQGTSETTFSPDLAMTRAMLVTVLYRLEQMPEVRGKLRFEDVPEDSYYANAVLWASNNGIVNGTDELSFSPDSTLTREQLATILYRFAAYKRGSAAAAETFVLDGYGDSPNVASYAREALAWAVELGLIRGDTSTGDLLLNPRGNASRAQVAVILMRFLTN